MDPRSPVPMYQQIVESVKANVAKGILNPGDKLQSVRELSVELAINHNTVAKAYRELERENVIEVIRGRGTFITLQPTAPNAEQRREEMRETIRKLLIEAHHLRMSHEELWQMFHQVMEEWRLSRETEAPESTEEGEKL
ncbi:GntR family transcriptional regulator [Alicyclobacillus acidoterrestris]|uniref:GntR family transcriptional regulator n=1 Tax=Alicyclobacillus acidoterrestris TaxID=1450 RepID=UPI003F53426F